MATTTTVVDSIDLAPVGHPASDIPLTAISKVATPAPIDESQAAPVRSNVARAAILFALYLSEFIAALDALILATSVPVICSDLHSSSGYLWIGAAFTLANACGTPVWAKLSDIWGRKPIMICCIVIFALGSVISATSATMNILIAGRAVQGVAAGGISSAVIIIISDLFSVRQRTLYLGIAEFVWVAAGAIGPILGGTLTEYVTWRWNFYINLPVSGTALVLIILFLNVHNPRTSFKSGFLAIDWFGTLSILAVTLMILIGLNFGGAVYSWSSPQVICLLVIGASLIFLFLFSEKRLAKYPLIPLHIFRDRSTSATFALVLCHGISQLGAEYYLPLYFQSVRGASPLRSGVLILPLILCTSSGGVLAAFSVSQTGTYRAPMWIGMALLTTGIGLLTLFNAHTSLGETVGFQILGGLGAGMLFQPPLVAIQAAVRQADTASASATVGFVRNIANSLGFVLGGVVFQNGMDHQAASLRAAGLNKAQLADFSSSNAAASVEKIKDIANVMQKNAVRDAYNSSLRGVWIMFACIAGLGLAVSALIKHNNLSQSHSETRTGIDELSKREN